MRVFISTDPELKVWRRALGPADLTGEARYVSVEGEASPAEAGRWASAISLAVARGASVRRVIP